MSLRQQNLDHQLQQVIFFLFNLLLVITPFVFTWVNEELFEFNKMLVVYAGTILITAIWCVRILLSKKIIFRRSPLDIPLLLFLFSQLLSTVFSLHPRTSLFGYYTRFHGGLLSSLAYALLYWAAVSNLKRKQLKPLLFSSLAAAGLIAVYAVFEHFGRSFSCLLIHGQFDTACWIQDVQARVFASFGQPNWLAAYLSMLLPISLVFWHQAMKKGKLLTNRSVWLGLTSTLMYLALLFTNSRSGFIAFWAGLIALVLINLAVKVNLHWLPLKKLGASCQGLMAALLPLPGTINFSYKKSAAIAIFIIGSSLWVGTPFSENISHIADKIPQLIGQSAPAVQEAPQLETAGGVIQEPDQKPSRFIGSKSSDIRRIVWKGAVKVWRRYPLLGSGVETFAYSYYQDRPMEHNLLSEWDFLYNKAHNEFLNYLATTGLLGFISYTWLTAAMLISGLTAVTAKKQPRFGSRLNKQDSRLIAALTAGLIALNISNFFGFSTVTVSLLMFFFAAGIALLRPDSTAASEETDETAPCLDESAANGQAQIPGIDLLTIFSLVMTGLITIHLLFSVWKIWYADFNFTQGKSLISLQEYQQGIDKLETAIALSPKQGLFYDELSNTYTETAVQLAAVEEAEAASDFIQLAVAASDQALNLNPYQLNFYKTRSRVFSQLAAIDPAYLDQAEQTLLAAAELAPTDPKLIYQLGLIKLTQDKTDQAINYFSQAIEMKPNYHQARYKLGQVYEQEQQYKQAEQQYQYLLEYLIPNDPNLKQQLQAVREKMGQQN